jgi:hypothetical protein
VKDVRADGIMILKCTLKQVDESSNKINVAIVSTVMKCEDFFLAG